MGLICSNCVFVLDCEGACERLDKVVAKSEVRRLQLVEDAKQRRNNTKNNNSRSHEKLVSVKRSQRVVSN